MPIKECRSSETLPMWGKSGAVASTTYVFGSESETQRDTRCNAKRKALIMKTHNFRFYCSRVKGESHIDEDSVDNWKAVTKIRYSRVLSDNTQKGYWLSTTMTVRGRSGSKKHYKHANRINKSTSYPHAQRSMRVDQGLSFKRPCLPGYPEVLKTPKSRNEQSNPITNG